MTIKRVVEYDKPMPIPEIHGKYPFKLYLEMIGTNKYGRYIVIVSKQLVDFVGEYTKVRIIDDNNLVDSDKKLKTKRGTLAGNGLLARMMLSKNVQYTVKKVNMLVLKKTKACVTVFEIGD